MSSGSVASSAAMSFFSLAGTCQASPSQTGWATPAEGSGTQGFASILQGVMTQGRTASEAATGTPVHLPSGLLTQLLKDFRDLQSTGNQGALSQLLAHFTAMLKTLAKDNGIDLTRLFAGEDGKARLLALLEALAADAKTVGDTQGTQTLQAENPFELIAATPPVLPEEGTKGGQPETQAGVTSQTATGVALAATQASGKPVEQDRKEQTKLAGLLEHVAAAVAALLSHAPAASETSLDKVTSPKPSDTTGTTAPVMPTEMILQASSAEQPVIPVNVAGAPEVPQETTAPAFSTGQEGWRAPLSETYAGPRIETLLKDLIAAARSMEQGQADVKAPAQGGEALHIRTTLEGLQVAKEAPSPFAQQASPVEAAAIKDAKLLVEFGDTMELVEKTTRDAEGTSSKGDNLFGRADSGSYTASQGGPSEAGKAGDFGTIVADRIAKVIEQTRGNEMRPDVIMRLKVEGAESFMISLKDQGGRVMVDVRCYDDKMASMLRAQKDDIERHLQEKHVNSTISVTPIDQEDPSRRERREQRREQWGGRNRGTSQPFFQMTA